MIVAYVFKRKLHLELTWQLKLVFVPLCFYAVWLLAPQGSLPYIYFDF
jgi:alginate O-acetyltransferase complex protein AlgI